MPLSSTPSLRVYLMMVLLRPRRLGVGWGKVEMRRSVDLSPPSLKVTIEYWGGSSTLSRLASIFKLLRLTPSSVSLRMDDTVS